MHFRPDLEQIIQGTLLFASILYAKKLSTYTCVQSADFHTLLKSRFSCMCKHAPNQTPMQPVTSLNSVPSERLNNRLFLFCNLYTNQ